MSELILAWWLVPVTVGITIGVAMSAGIAVVRNRFASHSGVVKRQFEEMCALCPVGMFQMDRQGWCTYINKRWKEITGMDSADGLGFGWLQTLSPDERESYLKKLTSPEYRPNGAAYDRQLYRPDGERVWMRITHAVLVDADGEKTGLVGTVENITEQKNAEARLTAAKKDAEAAELRFRTLCEHMPVGVYEADEQGNATYLNLRWTEIAGLSLEDALGQGWLKSIHPDDLEMGRGISQHLDELSYDLRMVRPNGDVRWIKTFRKLVRGVGAKPRGVVGIVEDITEERAKDEQLRAAKEGAEATEARFLVLSEQLPVGVFQADQQGQAIYLNSRWQEITGLTFEQARGRGWEKCIHPDYVDVVARGTHASGAAETHDWLLVRPNGEQRWVHSTVTVMRKIGSEAGGLVGILEDVTDRRRAQEVLHAAKETAEAAEHRFRALCEQMPVGVFQADDSGNTIYTNSRSLEISGLSLEAALGQGWLKCIHPEDLETVMIAPQLGGVNSFDMRMVRPSGEIRWVHTTRKFIEGAVGMPGGVIGVVEDVTDRRRNEEELRTAQQGVEAAEVRFRALCEQIPIGVFESDPQGNLVYVNSQCLEISGQSIEQSLGKGFLKSVHPDDMAMILAGVNRPVEHTLDLRVVRPNGEVRWVRSSRRFVGSVSGNMVGCMNDITDLRRHEEDLKSAKEAAEAGSRAKSEFLAAMSHEIRTPMNGIIGMASLLEETELSTDQREYARIMRASAHSLLTILNDILDFSKIEAGKMEIELLPFDLRAAIEETAGLFQQQFASKGVDLIVKIASDLPPQAWGDSGRVQQVLRNLLGNGMKFTEQGRVRLEVSQQKQNGEAEIHFTVEDTGIGIPADKLDLIFEGFTQADASTTRRFGGTGLGLAISKRLVNMMGGTMGVRSELGTGSAFWFTLPMAVAAEPQPQTERIPQRQVELKELVPASGGASELEFAHARVLVVEDNAVNQKLAVWMLEKLGCGVDVANDGRAGVEMALQQSYAAIFMDCQMPEMDGFEATHEIRRREGSGPRRAIVAMTANAMHGDREKCLEAGMDDYISKPISKKDLLQALRRHVRPVEPAPVL